MEYRTDRIKLETRIPVLRSLVLTTLAEYYRVDVGLVSQMVVVPEAHNVHQGSISLEGRLIGLYRFYDGLSKPLVRFTSFNIPHESNYQLKPRENNDGFSLEPILTFDHLYRPCFDILDKRIVTDEFVNFVMFQLSKHTSDLHACERAAAADVHLTMTRNMTMKTTTVSVTFGNPMGIQPWLDHLADHYIVPAV